MDHVGLTSACPSHRGGEDAKRGQDGRFTSIIGPDQDVEMAEMERKSVEGFEMAKIYANKLNGIGHFSCLNVNVALSGEPALMVAWARRSRPCAVAGSSASSLRTQSFGPPHLLVCQSASTSTVPLESP